MTGFSSLTHEDAQATVGVSIRTVNHRFLDVQLRLPPSLAAVEPRLRGLVQKRLARGRVELALTLQLRTPSTPDVELNTAFIEALSAALDRARDAGLVEGRLAPGDLLRFPQSLTIRDRPADADPAVDTHLAAGVEAAVEQALADLDAMRVREGGHLAADLDGRLLLLADLLEQLSAAAARGRSALEERLNERLREISLEVPVDQAMLAQEVVRMAGRSDISEEVTRFRAHLAHWRILADGAEPCGRKLDFLLQEMNREINTIGSKADGLGVAELIIAAKAELEKMREQVQNVE